MTSVDTSSRDAGRSAAWGTALLLLTSIHHVYGGYVYGTPWRYHAVPVSMVTAMVMVGALSLWRRQPAALVGRVARVIFALTTIAVPVVCFGLFEGLYNHVIKNLLYFAAVPAAVLTRLFPPPIYEMPNDIIFEVTGVLQVVPAALAAWFVYRYVRPPRPSAQTMAEFACFLAKLDDELPPVGAPVAVHLGPETSNQSGSRAPSCVGGASE